MKGARKGIPASKPIPKKAPPTALAKKPTVPPPHTWIGPGRPGALV